MITFIKAFRTDENTVYAMYAHDEYHQRFVVEWNNVHPETGKVENYDLQINCLSNSASLNEMVEDAIREGDSELYDLLNETFDRMDCESV